MVNIKIKRSELNSFDCRSLERQGYCSSQAAAVSKFKQRAKKGGVTLEWFERKEVSNDGPMLFALASDGRMYGLTDVALVDEFVHVEYLADD